VAVVKLAPKPPVATVHVKANAEKGATEKSAAIKKEQSRKSSIAKKHVTVR